MGWEKDSESTFEPFEVDCGQKLSKYCRIRIYEKTTFVPNLNPFIPTQCIFGVKGTDTGWGPKSLSADCMIFQFSSGPARWSLCHSTVYPLFEISSMHVFMYSTETLLEFYFQILCKFWLAFQACQVHNLCSGEGKICDVITSILFFQNDFSLRYNFQHNHKRFWSASLL